jgi:hypothetical protein
MRSVVVGRCEEEMGNNHQLIRLNYIRSSVYIVIHIYSYPYIGYGIYDNDDVNDSANDNHSIF